MEARWRVVMAVAAVTVAGLAGPALAEDTLILTDQAIEQLATSLTRVAEGASPRPVAYFSAEPTAQVKAYLEGQGIEVVVSPGPPPGTMPAAAPAPAIAAPSPPSGAPTGPYGLMGMRVPDTKKLFQDFLSGVREVARGLPATGSLAVEGFTVDLPGGSILFRIKEATP